MEQFEQLFKEVNQIVQQAKVAKEESRLRGEQFNIFKVCGIDHYELQHSAIIAELLNPHGSHGQGCLYLKLFMKTYGSSIDIAPMEEKSICVRTEEWTSDYDGRMDIYVEYQDKPIIIVENKLYARDQSIQLQRYDKDAKQRNSPKYDIVYLTLDGRYATKDSAGEVKYYRMSYAHDVVNWLDMCIMHSVNKPLIRETLVQYKNHINILTHQDMDEQSKNELFEIMLRNHEEVDAIIKASNDGYFDFLFEKYVKPKLQSFASEKGLVYEEPLSFTKREWPDARICIDPNYVNAGCGIKCDNNKEKREKLWDYDGTPSWPYGWFNSYIFHNWKESTLFSPIISGSFSNDVIKSVTKVLDDIATAGVDLTK